MIGRISVLVKKEWKELIHRRGLIFSTLLMYLIFLLIPFAIGLLIPSLQGESAYSDPDMERALSAMLSLEPELAHLNAADLFEILIFRQFMLFFLIGPVIGGLSIAAYSIIGEKVGRSLEPLLATPVRTAELLWGKCLAAAIPTVLLTWLCFGLYGVGIRALLSPEVLRHVFNTTALLVVFLIAPMIGVLGLSVGIITSSRSTDPRSAQQVSLVVILPLLGVVLSQIFGLFQLTPGIVLMAAGVLVVIDFFVLRAGSSLFDRETILTRWK